MSHNHTSGRTRPRHRAGEHGRRTLLAALTAGVLAVSTFAGAAVAADDPASSPPSEPTAVTEQVQATADSTPTTATEVEPATTSSPPAATASQTAAGDAGAASSTGATDPGTSTSASTQSSNTSTVPAPAAKTAETQNAAARTSAPSTSSVQATLVNPNQPYCNAISGSGGAFQQWNATRGWTSGNAGKTYTEGDWVPQRAELQGLAAGDNQLIMTFGYVKGVTVGYDDVRFVQMTTSGGTAIPVAMHLSVSTPSGAADGTATFNFTLPTGSAGTVWLYYDVHLANTLSYIDLGMRGAAYYSGSSLHTGLVSLNCVGLGTSALSIPASAIPYGTVTIDKVTVPSGDPTLFDFTISGGGASDSFQLADATTPWSSRLGTNQFTVTENDIPAGWKLKDLACTGTTATYSGSTATFTVTDGSDILCTFTNSKIAYKDLTISKTATPAYTATYAWGIDKVAGQTSYTVVPNGSVDVGYTVTASQKGVTYSGAKVTGAISVSNPNDIPMTVTGIADSLPGAQCSLNSRPPFTVAAKGTVDIGYACSYADGSIPANSTNTATVTWAKSLYYGTSGTASATAAVEWTAATKTEVNKTVTITDSDYTFVPPWTLTYGDEANVYTRTYSVSRSLDGKQLTSGCYAFDNTATITADGKKVLASDGATVKVCELGILTDILGTSQANFTWDITKTAGDPTTVNDPTGSHAFGYSVTVHPSAPAYSASKVFGTIRVTVPTGAAAVTGTLTDFLDITGTTCVLAGTTQGTVTVPADGSAHTFTYSCDLGATTPRMVVNTAVIAWGPGSQTATATATLAAGAWQVGLTNESLKVYDDMAGSSDVLLGTITVDLTGAVTVVPASGYTAVVGEDGSVTFTYDVTHRVPAGTCNTFVNTATGVPGDDGPLVSDDANVTLCAPAALTVSKTATTSYTLDHDWSIAKEADSTVRTVGPDGGVAVTYTVTAKEAGIQYRDVKVAGTITVTNPNTAQVALTSVVDTIPGAACALVDDAPTSIAGGATVSLPYTCTFADGTTLPADGVNSVSVGYTEAFGTTPETATGSAGFSWSRATVNELDRSVTITDSNHTWDPAWVVTAGESPDGISSKSYTVTYKGQQDAVCTSYDNTAKLTDDGVVKEATTTVTVCTLTGSKTAAGTAGADFTWDITKTGGPDTVIDNSGTHDFSYAVSVTPSAPVYADYAISGQITLTNPTGSEAVTGSLSDYLGIEGATCAVQGTTEGSVTVDAGQTKVLDYTCSLPDLPRPATVVNKALFVWADGTQQVLSTATVAADQWDVTLHNESLKVFDDMAGDTPVLLGTVTVDLAGTVSVEATEGYAAVVGEDGSVTFTYDATHSVTPGTCKTFVNTATGVPGDGGAQIAANASVELCAEVDLGVRADAAGTFDVTYPWAITKNVDRSRVSLVAGSTQATATYTVVATAGVPVVSGHAVTGTIEVSNTNDWAKEFSTSAAFPGGTCRVSGPTSVAAHSSATLDFTCSFPADYVISTEDAANLAAAEVVWAPLAGPDVTTGATAPATWTVDTETNKSVTVTDVWQGKTTKLGTLTWEGGSVTLATADDADVSSATLLGNSATFTYTKVLHLSGDPTCTTFLNVAQVLGDGGKVIASDKAATSACVAAPGLAKTGANTQDLSGMILGALLLGGGLFLVGRRRRRA